MRLSAITRKYHIKAKRRDHKASQGKFWLDTPKDNDLKHVWFFSKVLGADAQARPFSGLRYGLYYNIYIYRILEFLNL